MDDFLPYHFHIINQEWNYFKANDLLKDALVVMAEQYLRFAYIGLQMSFYAGGKVTNQAVAAAKINNNVHLTVKLGADEFSKKAKRYLTNTEISSFSFFENL